MANDPNALAIVKTIVQLGLNLNLVVTAEGVEDQSELEMLRELGCSEVQGYLISRPLNAATLEAFCQSHTPTP
ncbi:hypothetical protein CA602_23820 [Paraburkholderia hospita]|nr:hypothetical protein CA602_23820 [Paraburkholderia hospita]